MSRELSEVIRHKIYHAQELHARPREWSTPFNFHSRLFCATWLEFTDDAPDLQHGKFARDLLQVGDSLGAWQGQIDYTENRITLSVKE